MSRCKRCNKIMGFGTHEEYCSDCKTIMAIRLERERQEKEQSERQEKERELQEKERKRQEKESKRQEKERERQEKIEFAHQAAINQAIGYFSGEEIKIDSDIDKNSLKIIYDALETENENTVDADNMTDALGTLDANTYYFCKALIYQNFMLMRKVDKLSDMVLQLQREFANQKQEKASDVIAENGENA